MATKKSAPAKKAAAQAPAKKTPVKKAAAQAPAKKTPAKKAAAKPAGTTSTVKKSPVKKATAKPAEKKSHVKKATTSPVKKAPAKNAPAKKPAGTTAAAKAPAKKAPAQPAASAPAKTASSGATTLEIPAPRGVSKEGIAYTKDFDVKFLKAQWDLLLAERARLLGQAVRLEDEAHQLIEEAEMGDVQFDDEGGEGDTMVVERERDLALSAQARETIEEIDRAIARISEGTYGYSTTSGRPIPRERLEAIPWATELVSEKVGGIGRR